MLTGEYFEALSHLLTIVAERLLVSNIIAREKAYHIFELLLVLSVKQMLLTAFHLWCLTRRVLALNGAFPGRNLWNIIVQISCAYVNCHDPNCCIIIQLIVARLSFFGRNKRRQLMLHGVRNNRLCCDSMGQRHILFCLRVSVDGGCWDCLHPGFEKLSWLFSRCHSSV